MPNAWTNHCKNYASEHGCSYKEALTRAKSTYNPASMEGGKFSIKKVKKGIKRAVKGAKKGSKMLDKADQFIELVDEDAAEKVRNIHNKAKKKANSAAHLAKEGQEIFEGQIEGGRFNLHKAIRKTKNTAKKVKKVSKNASKYYDMVKPGLEMVPVLGNVIDYADAANSSVKIANEMTGGKMAVLGSRANGKVNPYLNGGSFRVPEQHGGSFSVPSHGGCMSCNKTGSGVPFTNSSMINPYHPSFHPNKPKPFNEKIYTN